MRRRIGLVLTVLAAAAALVIPPWLAYREARRQAYDAEVAQALGYARDVVHRSDKTAMQALRGIQRLARSGYPPCSEPSRALMRQIDLASSYVQAIGVVRNGVFVCSSMGDAPIALGKKAARVSSGSVIYLDVPVNAPDQSPLVALELDGYAALIHRDLPIDASTSVPDISLAVVHLEYHPATIARGFVDPSWLDRLDDRREAAFVTRTHLVVLSRSRRFRVAAIAAVPVAYLDQRAAEIAGRLVPAGLLAGLAAAAALLLFARQRMSIEAALKAALKRDEFLLLYQPIVDLRSGAWVGVEALLRWRRPNGELVGPDLFVPIAEQSGLIGRFTERVLELVAKDAGPFLARHPHFHVAINLSAADLHSPAICARLDAMLQRCGARPSNLLVEITERGFLQLDLAREVLAALRARSIEVAIDDFGTGYSSLSYLQTLPLDFLKIDRAFVEAIGTEAPTSQVVHHIIDIARTMRLRMIAEGIENLGQAAVLRERGVEFGQGWLFGMPMPFDDIARTVEAGTQVAA